jgi:hypothetical protein
LEIEKWGVGASFWLEPEKKGGWSLLLVGERELEVGASLNVILKDI